jgi:hypothetical protein
MSRIQSSSGFQATTLGRFRSIAPAVVLTVMSP